MSQQIVGKRVLLKSVSGEYLLPYVDSSGTGNPDNKTIMINDQVQLVAFGNTTKDGSYNYDWFGTVEEYNDATEAGTIQPDWTCFITDFDTAQLQGVERKHVLNNPFTLLQSQYSETPLNGSWLESLGQWNDGTLYSTVYDAIATEIDTSVAVGTVTESGYVKKGLTNVKLSTDVYTDYDFVINQTDHTFRLPLLDGSEDLVSDRYETLTLKASGSTYTAPANGWFSIKTVNATQNGFITAANLDNLLYVQDVCNFTGSALGISIRCLKGSNIVISYLNAGALDHFSFIYAEGNGSLYYYVGDTITDVQTIAANNVLSALPRKLDVDLANLPDDTRSMMAGFGMPSDRYNDLTIGASLSKYTAPANGYFAIRMQTTSTQAYLALWNTSTGKELMGVSGWYSINIANISHCIPVRKGDVIQISYQNCKTVDNSFLRFIYAEGSEND